MNQKLSHLKNICHPRFTLSFILLSFILVNSFGLKSQNAFKVDSLNKELSKLITQKPDNYKENEAYYNLLNDLSYAIVFNRPDSALVLSGECEVLSRKSGSIKSLSYALRMQGIAYERMGEYDNSIGKYLAAEEAANEISDSILLAKIYNGISIPYTFKGELYKALKYLFKAYDLVENGPDNLDKAYILTNIGNTYKYIDDFELCERYYLKSMAIQEKLGNKTGLSHLENNMGIIYLEKEELGKAIASLTSALAHKRELNELPGIANSLNNLGVAYMDSGLFHLTLPYLQEALEIRTKIKDKRGLASIYSNMARYYLESKMYEEVFSYASKSLALSKELEFKDFESVSNRYLSDYYKAKNDYRNAFIHLELFTKLKEEFEDINNKSHIAELTKMRRSIEMENDSLSKIVESNDTVLQNIETKLSAKRKQLLYSLIGYCLLLIPIGIYVYNTIKKEKESKSK
jgi:tetratricopeptide (TPR) repeat protein